MHGLVVVGASLVGVQSTSSFLEISIDKGSFLHIILYIVSHFPCLPGISLAYPLNLVNNAF